MVRRIVIFGIATVLAAVVALDSTAAERAKFQAGAAAVDITPTRFPVVVNGMFDERQATQAHDRLMSRALVLDDGEVKLAIVVVDSLMIPRSLLDDAKRLASSATGIPTDRMLISATHTHSAPSVMGCLGSGIDGPYTAYLPAQIARSVAEADRNRQPARIGWTVVEDPVHNHCRRWIFRPDRMPEDPFGERNVRAHMHPGHQSANHIGPSGPADTGFTLLSVQTPEGQPLAVLANYAMHYYGSPLISGDFCGRFGDQLAKRIGAVHEAPAFVGIMSQGTSGDSMWPDYSLPAGRRDLDAYTEAVAAVAFNAYRTIHYRQDLTLAMAETTLTLRRRVPDEPRLQWAREVLRGMGDRAPRSRTEVYAREQMYLHEQPEVELKLQAIRVGELGITALPNEVYGLTGLKLKARSPLTPTFNIELANGAEGYIPPPEQHKLGGYTTWPARTAGLEVEAEPKIVEALLSLLEEVADKPRRREVDPLNAYAAQVLEARPTAFWRLGEMSGRLAHDATAPREENSAARYEDGAVLFLPSFEVADESGDPVPNRAAHFAGGRVVAEIPEVGPQQYSVAFWFWNGLPHDARAVTAYLVSRGNDGDPDASGDHLGIGGTNDPQATGKLIFFNGNRRNQLLTGRTTLGLKSWHHVTMVRDGDRVTVYLDGNREPEISGRIPPTYDPDRATLFLGGRNDKLFGLEGKMDEVAVFDRPLQADEVVQWHAVVADDTPAR